MNKTTNHTRKTKITTGSKTLVAMAFMTAASHGAITFSTANSGPSATTTDELTYASDVSTTDLLAGIVGTGGAWNGNGSSPDGLNDGLTGGDFNADGLSALGGKAWAADGTASFREFVLGAGANGLGFDIDSVQSIASWSGSGFSNQRYEIEVRPLGGAFTTLTTVNFQPLSNLTTAGGSTRVIVSDDAGLLASGIDAIRFNILDTTSNNGGGAVFSEIDVFGTATPPIPEPSSMGLLALAGFGFARRRRA